MSTWSPDASIASCEDMVEDELYIRRVFSFDEWEYNHPQYQTKSPLHREPISSSCDKNRYQDSLQTLIQLPAAAAKQTCTTTPTTPSTTSNNNTPSLFQEIWEKKLEHHGGSSPNRRSFSTVSTSPETPIPSPESAFRQFQKQYVSPIDTTTTFATAALPSTTTMAPWCNSIPREGSSEGSSFVQIDLNNDNNNNNDDSEGNNMMQQPRNDSWSIPEYVLVDTTTSMEEEEEVEL